MNRSLIVALLVILAFASSASAVNLYRNVSHAVGYLSEDLIMSEPLPQGKACLSGNIEYYMPSDVMINVSHPKWESLNDGGVDAVSLTVIPIKVAYGITDALSVRLTIPYISESYKPELYDASSATGIGDARLEGIYLFMKETESFPSIAGSLGIKLATGKYKDLKDTELALGTGGTDIYASAIFGKKLGPVNGKALIGYMLTGRMVDYLGSGLTIDPADPIIFSVACIYPATADINIGGELWGRSGGKDLWTNGDSIMVEDSEGTVIWLSPFVNYQVSPALGLRGVIDYPLSVPATNSMLGGGENLMKGLNITIGANWII